MTPTWKPLRDNAWGLFYPRLHIPETVIFWGGNEDACYHIYRYYNGARWDDDNVNEDDVDYMHICDLAEFAEALAAFPTPSP